MAKAAAKTAIAAALDAAGYQPPRERLEAIADTVLAGTFATREAMVQAVVNRISGDAELLWALFAPFANKAIGELLELAAARRAQARRQATSTASSGATASANTTALPPQQATGGSAQAVAGPTSAQKQQAQADNAEASNVRVMSKLDTFRINNRPIGDCTPEEILAWCASQSRGVRYGWLLANSGVPHGHRVRDFITPEEADVFYARAQEEVGNG